MGSIGNRLLCVTAVTVVCSCEIYLLSNDVFIKNLGIP